MLFKCKCKFIGSSIVYQKECFESAVAEDGITAKGKY